MFAGDTSWLETPRACSLEQWIWAIIVGYLLSYLLPIFISVMVMHVDYEICDMFCKLGSHIMDNMDMT